MYIKLSTCEEYTLWCGALIIIIFEVFDSIWSSPQKTLVLSQSRYTRLGLSGLEVQLHSKMTNIINAVES